MFTGFRTEVDAAAVGARAVSAAAIDAADASFVGALDRIAATQREIDVLLARRAREVAAAVVAAERVEIVSGTPRARTAEFVHRSTRAELALALRVSEYSAERLMVESAALDGAFSDTRVAVENGRLSWREAVVIVECARGLDDGTEAGLAAVAAVQEAAIDLASRVAPSRLRSRLNALRDRIEIVPPEERHAAARAERHVTLEDVANGMSWLHALLPSIEAHAILNRLTDVAHAAQHLDAEDGFDDGRAIDQRRADLLVDFIAGDHVRIGEHEARIAQGRDFGRFAGIRPTVVVTVPVQTLLPGDAAGPAPAAMLDGIVPIDPATARALVANAPGLYRMLVEPHTGVRLDLGRTRYRLSPELRLWLRLRDETCRFPGCGHLAKGADVDHTVDWQYGGETRADNLAHLCRGHHTLKHETRWHMEQHPDGRITWRGPSGREYRTRPGSAFARAA